MPLIVGVTLRPLFLLEMKKSRIDFREISCFQQNSLFRLLGIHEFFAKLLDNLVQFGKNMNELLCCQGIGTYEIS
jgi:hypothetical protein